VNIQNDYKKMIEPKHDFSAEMCDESFCLTARSPRSLEHREQAGMLALLWRLKRKQNRAPE